MAKRFSEQAKKVSLMSLSVNQWRDVALNKDALREHVSAGVTVKKEAQGEKILTGVTVKREIHTEKKSARFESDTSRRTSFMDTFKLAVGKVRSKVGIAATPEETKKPSEDEEFHSIFNLPKKEVQNTSHVAAAEKEEDPYSSLTMPPMKDHEVINFVSTELAGQVLESKPFRYFILACILVNSLMIAIQTNKDMERKFNHFFVILDQFMMTIFVCEILLKWYHGFLTFWLRGWNILDFFIVVALIFGPYTMSDAAGGRGVIRILRVLRAFRSLRSISSLPGLQIVVQTMLQSIPDMANIVLLLVIIMLVFSVIGITLFREILPKYFGDLSTAMFSLFICVTQDGWMEIFEAFQSQGAAYYTGGGLFLIVFIAIGAFIFANLIVAVVVTNLECAVKDVKEEELLQAKELELKGKLDNEDGESEVDIINLSGISSNVFRCQKPLVTPDLTNLTVTNIENYLLVVAAMEENLQRYKVLLKDLNRFFSEACELNKSAMDEGVIEEPESSNEARNLRKQSARKATRAGDIMSSFMDLEGSQLITTRTRNSIREVIRDSASLSFSAADDSTYRRRSSVIG